MNTGICRALGVILVLLAAGFAAVGWFFSGLEEQRPAVGCGLLALFCAVGAMASLVPASRAVTLRLIGGSIFLVSVAYLVDMAAGGPILGRSRAETSLVNAVAALMGFGLPAGYMAIRGRYPDWGRHREAFGTRSSRPGDEWWGRRVP